MRPGKSYKHYVLRQEVRDFIAILPQWEELATGLRAVVLAAGEPNAMGWYGRGVIGICAWERDPWLVCSQLFYRDHARALARLGVPCERRGQR